MANQDNLIHSSSFVDEGAKLGVGNKIWHFSHLMTGCTIGDECNIGQNVFIASGVVLGNNVKVQNNVSLFTGVSCGDNVFIGPSVVFTNVINPRSAVTRKHEYQPTLIGEGASIGANATIICGNTIGKFAMIGAGAVVTKSVEAYALVVGSPARQIGWMSEHGEKLAFDSGNKSICTLTQQEYSLANDKVQRIK